MPAQHLPIFIHDLAIILMAAGVISIVFRWLKQPVILGYVAAGIIVGPHTSITPTVSDVENIRVWGEIGVIFVLFSIGLEFSFRRLLQVGGSAFVTAGVETVSVLLLGTLVGLAIGLPQMDAIFLGGMLCISSTMMIMKVFEEQGLKGRGFAQLVMGVIIVEDLVAVLLLVLLSTLAVTRELAGGELAMAAVRLGFFITLWFVIGLFLLPGLMRAVRGMLSAETTLIFCVGLCLMMVIVATHSGFSPALGAFVMGSLLAETDEQHRIEEVLHPLRHFFGAVFFVSVGMLLDPRVLFEQWPFVLGMTAVLIVGKTVAVTAGAMIAGQDSRNALRAGLSMTQIGEFSFIIASLGLSLNVISARLYPIAVGISLLSACLTPMLIRRADGLHGVIERWLPGSWLATRDRYQAALSSEAGNQMFPALLRAYLPLIAINLVLILATTWLARFVLYPQLESLIGPSSSTRLLGVLIDLLLCLPFFWGLCLRRPSKRWREMSHTFGGVRWIEGVMVVVRFSLGTALALIIVAQYLSWRALSGITFALFLAVGILFYAYGGKVYRRLERHLLGQLDRGDGAKEEPALLPWDAHLTEISVASEAPICGRAIETLAGEAFSIMIAAIDRGKTRILAPKGSELIFPHDRLSVIGSDADIERLRKLTDESTDATPSGQPLRLQSIILSAHSELLGKSIRDSGLRERAGGLLVGLERKGFRQLNPPPDLSLETGDRLWIVGDPGKISRLA